MVINSAMSNKFNGNSDSLILDVTNNTVKQVNNVKVKFIRGKRVNFTASGSYQTMCFGAVTSWNSERSAIIVFKKNSKS